jgi:hypothetical protein
MKLNREQINALSQQIAGDINKKVTEYNQKIRDKALKDFLKTPEGKAATYLYSKYPNIYNINPVSLCKVNGLRVNVASSIIANDIIIQTIECDNLQQIIDKIKSKYE